MVAAAAPSATRASGADACSAACARDRCEAPTTSNGCGCGHTNRGSVETGGTSGTDCTAAEACVAPADAGQRRCGLHGSKGADRRCEAYRTGRCGCSGSNTGPNDPSSAAHGWKRTRHHCGHNRSARHRSVGGSCEGCGSHTATRCNGSTERVAAPRERFHRTVSIRCPHAAASAAASAAS
jgi:hypothetical protein